MATVPSIRAWISEYLTATKMNEISSMLTFLANMSGGVFLGRQGSSQPILSGSDTFITFDGHDFDVDGGHSTTTNNNRYTAHTAGKYLAAGAVFYGASGAGSRGAFVRKNGGGTQLSYGRGAAAPDGPTYQSSGVAIVSLNGSGDYLELCGRHTAASTLSTDITNGGSLFAIVRLAA